MIFHTKKYTYILKKHVLLYGKRIKYLLKKLFIRTSFLYRKYLIFYERKP